MDLSSFKKYLSLEKHYSPHTCEAYIRDLLQFQMFLESYELTLEQATYPIIRQWMASLVEKEISSQTVNRKMSSLKTYYKYLLQQGKIDVQVMSSHKSLKTSAQVQVPFSKGELQSILESPYNPESFEEVRDRLIIELLYVTGMRRAELISLRIIDVQLESKQLKVKGKRNKERIIPLLTQSLNLIKDYLKLRDLIDTPGNAFLITVKGRPLYPSLVYRVVSNFFKKASLKVKVSPHVLRHSFATHLLDQGADLNSVKELLGHSSLASTQVYTHTSMQALKKIHATAHPRNLKNN